MTYDEQRDNYVRLAAKRIAQLEKKLAAGTITQAQYDKELKLVSDAAPVDADSEFWDDVWDEVVVQVGELPGQVSSAVNSASSWDGHTIGSAAGNLVGGATKGLFTGWANPVTIIGGIIIVGVIAWAFLKGPLKGAKAKIIPIPV